MADPKIYGPDGRGPGVPEADQAAIREMIKPLILEMHRLKMVRVVIDKAGPDVNLTMFRSVSYTCPTCKMTSYHPGDVEAQYCGNCLRFSGTDEV